MKNVTTIGIDLAKSVFQVHGIDATGEPVIRRQLRRRQVLRFFEKLPRCLVGRVARVQIAAQRGIRLNETDAFVGAADQLEHVVAQAV